VVEPALKLIDTFDTLSRGWGLGLLGGTILCWAMALGQFIQLLDKPTSDAKLADGQPPPANIPLITILSMVPFWMASDITQTSSLCDQLVDTINDAGIRYREPCYTRIAWLESRLTQLNRGQGLGFKVAGTVIDQRLLNIMAVSLAGGLSTVLTTLFALTDESAAVSTYGSGACAPSAAQVKLTSGGAGNCSFANLTIGSML